MTLTLDLAPEMRLPFEGMPALQELLRAGLPARPVNWENDKGPNTSAENFDAMQDGLISIAAGLATAAEVEAAAHADGLFVQTAEIKAKTGTTPVAIPAGNSIVEVLLETASTNLALTPPTTRGATQRCVLVVKVVTAGAVFTVAGGSGIAFEWTQGEPTWSGTQNLIELLCYGNGLQILGAPRSQAGSVVVTSKIKPLGAVSGTITPDLREGHVFTMTTTGATLIGAPTNPPGPGAAIYIEFEITGNHAVAFPLFKEWLGEEQALDLSSPESVNVVVGVSFDNGVTWLGIGSPLLPPDVVRVKGPKWGDIPIWNGETEKWEGGAPPPGVSKAEVDAEIAGKAVLTEGGPVGIRNGPESGRVMLGEGAGVAAFVSGALFVQTYATPRLTPGGTVTTNLTLVPGGRYTVTTPGVVLLMPPAELTNTSAVVAVDNQSGGTITLKGKFTPGSEAESTIEMSRPEVLTLMAFDTTHWQPWARYAAPANRVDVATAAGGFAGQSFDLPHGSAAAVTGRLHLAKIMLPDTVTLSKVFVNVVTGGSTFTVARAALFTSAGVFLGKSKDQKGVWNSAGAAAATLRNEGDTANVTPTVTGGQGVFIYGAILVAATTMPVFAEAGVVGRKRDVNVGLTAEALRAGEAKQAGVETFTVIPGTITPAESVGLAADVPFFWIAVA